MLITLLLFLLSAITIYRACEYFVNGIEWTGHHFKLSQSATGSLLAALGTALPECIVTLTALLMGDAPAQQQIGIGAALGGPLVLATIGYAAVGVTLLLCMSREHRAINGEVQREIGRDQTWFAGIFLLAVLLGMVAFTGKTWLAPLFVLIYLLYVRRELKQTDSHDAELPSPSSWIRTPGSRRSARCCCKPWWRSVWWRWRLSCSFTSWRAWASCSASLRCWQPCC